MLLRQITDSKLAQNAYLIGCQRTGEALVIDPERDVDRYVEAAAAEGLRLVAATETHIHADFLSGCRELGHSHGARLYLSDCGPSVWKYQWARGGGNGIHLLHAGDTFSVGKIEIRALHTPGHTPEHVCFLVTDHGGGAEEPMGLVSGDFVFVGDVGRPDLLESAAGVVGAREPSARALFASLQHFLDLPDYLQIWPGHGAGSACGKALGAVPTSTVGYERRFSTALADVRRGEQAFVDAILEGQPEPPFYFARMKKENKEGPRILGPLPAPKRLAIADIADRAQDDTAVVLDTRRKPAEFMNRHLARSLHAPLGNDLPTIAGSYVLPGQAMYLIVDQQRVDEAVRALVRIGLDDVAGFATPADLETYSGPTRATAVVDWQAIQDRRNGSLVLDVRGASEFAASHVDGALNIAHTRLLPRLEEVPSNRPALVHCRSGARAAAAAAFLERHGRQVSWVADSYRAG